MAKWVYLRGYPNIPTNTLHFTSAANVFLTNVQTACGLTVDSVDIEFHNNVVYVAVVYDNATPIDLGTVF